LILVDLDRANQRAVAAEREVTVLQEQLKEMKSNKEEQKDVDDFSEDQTVELRNQLVAKEKEVVQLVEDVQKANKMLQESESKLEKRTLELEGQNNKLSTDLEEIQSKLSSQSDYESVKKDLSIMKSLYFPSHNTEEEDETIRSINS